MTLQFDILLNDTERNLFYPKIVKRNCLRHCFEYLTQCFKNLDKAKNLNNYRI